jgi:DNA (cytosine-5)-methyltransferase 1
MVAPGNSMTHEPTLVSLFSGAGGLDFGLEAAGFRTAAAVEVDTDCCRTLRANRPCQPFSKAGYWATGDSRRLADPRAGTLGAYMRVVEETLPKAFLLENVEGLAYQHKNEGLAFVLGLVKRINRRAKVNYRPTFRVLSAAEYGVPQVRQRLFLIAAIDGQQFAFPPATHEPLSTTDGAASRLAPLPPYRTAWDALWDVRPDPSEDLAMRGKWAELLPSIPEGHNYLFHTDRREGQPLFGWRRRYWSFLLKLAKNRPAWTIQAQPGPGTGPFHWHNRRLSMRELCRLQTFPEDVAITGAYRAVHKQVGNAVPSLLGEVLGRAIREQLLDKQRQSSPLRLLRAGAPPVPPPEPHTDVPRRFLRLRGAHEAHPGSRRGYRAQSWAAAE